MLQKYCHARRFEVALALHHGSNCLAIRSYLDNVSVMAAVPEPESYAMMLLGLGLLGFMARRKTAA